MKSKLKKSTYSLTDYDLNVLLPLLIKGLEQKKEKTNAVTANQIVWGLQRNGLKITKRHVFRLIGYIRMNDLVVGLMASSVGYYITNNEQELIKYEKRLMSREANLRNMRMSMKRQRATMFNIALQKKSQLF